MFSGIKSIMVCILVLLITGCGSQPDQTPKTENPVLNKRLQRGTITIINLDSIPVDTVLAQEENIMGKEQASSLTSQAVLDRAVDLAKIGDSLYVADGGQQCIWVMDRQGQWTRRVGRARNGPGEFGGLVGIDGNSTHIFTFDQSNARVQVYNHQFMLEITFDKPSIRSRKEIAVNDHSIYLLADYTEQHNLIEMHDTASPFDRIGSFWSPIVPYGRQPLAYNNYIISANNQNNVAVAFIGLPYIFILDSDQQVNQILYLESSLWQQIKGNIPSVKPKEHASQADRRVQAYILHLHLANNGNMYIRTRDAIYTFTGEHGNYQLHKATRFVTNEKIVKGRSGPVRVPSEAMDVKNDTVYFASGFTEYIFRFSL